MLFSGGGTLGSVTPLIAVAETAAAQNEQTEFLWVGTTDGPERALVEQLGIKFESITSGRLRRFLTLRNLATPYLVIKGLIEAHRLIGEWRPDVVVSAGGFVAVPVVWAAWLRGVPVHIHQMDWRPGLANKLSAPFAKSVSVTFEKSRGDFAESKVTVTGNPVRQFLFRGSIEQAREIFNMREGLSTVLVLGGGTGAVNLNRLTVEALDSLGEVQVLHVTGRGKQVAVSDPPHTYHQFEFLDAGMAHAYAVADLVVTRAGMGTLTELAALGLPAIIVPIPRSHQEDNAQVFVGAGAAENFSEQLPANELSNLVNAILSDSDRRRDMSSAMSALNSRTAAQNVAEILFSYGQS